MNRRYYGILFLFLLMMVVKVFADTSVPAGPITADTTWTQAGSPYIAAGSVLVMKDVTLTIEPGVEIRFGEGNSLQIDGQLIARGSHSNVITFTRSGGENWGYLLFSDSSVDASYDTTGTL